ncbi:cold shock-like protein CspC [Pantoea ananatis AJ13355]|uniref:Cold shock-like protein CspC n=1 Tax=Pantoea ananatis (strain AJ13355) TaxID=932677 RepID=A0A0H3KWJ1_PANAA|nr:cold shock-like protein CspC [Pantoea ananatis AJ13355]
MAVLDFELNVLAFGQRFEAVALNSREVYEYIFATVSWSDKTEAFRLVEPLNLTFNLCHFTNSLKCLFCPEANLQIKQRHY